VTCSADMPVRPAICSPLQTHHRASDQKGQYSSKVQQPSHRTARSPLSRCVLTSANEATNRYCAEFGTKRSQVQILSPRPLFGLVRVHFDSGARVEDRGLSD
jgi:hypothetical protein